MTTGPQQPEEDSNYIARVLKAGYFELMLEHPGLTDDLGQCLTPGSAFLMELETRCLKIPEKFEWETILEKVHPSHHERIKRIYEAAKKKKRDFEVNLSNLKNHWEKAPKIEEPEIEKVLQETGTLIRESYEGTLAAMLATPPTHEGEEPPSELEEWQNTDKRLREGVYKLDKDLLAAMRNYYEALLERPPKDEKRVAITEENPNDYVLQVPYNDSMRLCLMNEIRYLRLIDAVHQAVAIAKAAHHTQTSRRVRKSGNIPYVYHPIAVMNDTILDAIAYFIEEKKLPLDYVMLIVAAALHDLLEDSGRTLDDIVDFFASRADKYDSSIPIESGYGTTKEAFQKKVLDLFGGSTRSNVRRILHILSDNSPLSNDEKIAALAKNWAGATKTKSLLNVSEEDLKEWEEGLKKARSGEESAIPEEPQLETFKTFPQEPRKGKMSSFLVRMSGILKGDRDEVKKIAQAALIIKMEDRRHNLNTMEGKTVDQKLGQLRETTARLIAYAVLDHDQENYPLYNALPYLIDTALQQYIELKQSSEATNQITDQDREYMASLQQWQQTVRRYPVPEQLNKILLEYDRKRKTITDAELQAVPEKRRGLLGWLVSIRILKS